LKKMIIPWFVFNHVWHQPCSSKCDEVVCHIFWNNQIASYVLSHLFSIMRFVTRMWSIEFGKYYSLFNNIYDVMMHYWRLSFDSSVAWFEIPF
jgi:hypothetical protein